MSSAPNTNSENRLRLPLSVVPSAYRIVLATDLDDETFGGTVEIDAECNEPTDTVTLHSSGLVISRATVTVDSTAIEAGIDLDPEAEFVHLRLDNTLPVGPTTITLEYTGQLKDGLVGYYLSRFTDTDGTEHKLATTQFEAPYARQCFPCWDEPSFKATFTVSLITDPAVMAITNGAEVGRSPIGSGPYQGRVKVDFAPTVPMSTYLVAFVVGPLQATEPIDVNGVALRVIHPQGKEHLTSFALEAGAFALRYFTDYFGLPYPGDKLDLVAIPDFAFGAMENLGCVTFREALLLIDPQRSTKDELQRVADVINHEIAHMWFGDMVTMKWWNGIWLNEAFATFMEMKCTEAFRPEWDRWSDFSLSLTMAYATDSLLSTRPIEYEVVTPQDAEAMFDVLTYEKGAGVVRMLEQHLGEEAFKNGIRAYMEANQFSNAETTDLWDAIEISSGEPVRQTMDTWIFQGGYPTVEVNHGQNQVTFNQVRAVPIGSESDGPETFGVAQNADAARDQSWVIPFSYRTQSDGEAEPVTQRCLLTEPKTVAVEQSDDATLVANSDGSGFYRIAYDSETISRLAGLGSERLTTIERYALVDNAWAGVLTGHYSTPTFLNLLEAMTAETERPVWQRIVKGFSNLGHLVDGEAEDRLAEIVHDAIAPTLAGLGLAPLADESQSRRELRADLIRAMGIEARDPEIIEEAKRTVSVARRDPELVDTSIYAAAVSVVARWGDEADFDDFLAAREEANNPQEELRFMYALADFEDPALIARLYPLVLDGSIRPQNAPFVLARAVMNEAAGHQTWAFITDNFDQLKDLFASSLVTRMLQAASSLDQPGDYELTEPFLLNTETSAGERKIAQILETQRINIALRGREADRLAQFLIS